MKEKCVTIFTLKFSNFCFGVQIWTSFYQISIVKDRKMRQNCPQKHCNASKKQVCSLILPTDSLIGIKIQ